MTIRLRARSAIVLGAAPSSILDFESFVEGLPLLSPQERSCVLVAGGEMLDNVIKHGSPLRFRRLLASVRRIPGLKPAVELSFLFSARNFAAFAREGLASYSGEPRFDPAVRRWRGFGLLMCRNIARRVDLRPGRILDRIVIEFDAESRAG
jgi:hypothetical protein